jgi:hypothetical protein
MQQTVIELNQILINKNGGKISGASSWLCNPEAQ